MKAFIRIAVVLCLFAVAYLYVAPVRLTVLALAGRSGICSVSQSLDIPLHFKNEMAIKDRILAASKMIDSDAAFEHWETPYGPFWIPTGSKYVLPFNLAEQEMKIYGVGEQAVKPGDIVLDCGANVGVFVRESLKAGAKLVVAIEPAPENLECLRRNFKSEVEAGKVIIYPKGVWDKDDTLTMRVDPTNSAADTAVLKTDSMTKTVQVPLTMVDKLVAELKLEKVDYIKMDIEGAEPNALRGAVETIRKYKPRLSVSSYHMAEHPVLIPQAINAARTDYKQSCGPCNEVPGEHRIRPEILYFR